MSQSDLIKRLRTAPEGTVVQIAPLEAIMVAQAVIRLKPRGWSEVATGLQHYGQAVFLGRTICVPISQDLEEAITQLLLKDFDHVLTETQDGKKKKVVPSLAD